MSKLLYIIRFLFTLGSILLSVLIFEILSGNKSTANELIFHISGAAISYVIALVLLEVLRQKRYKLNI